MKNTMKVAVMNGIGEMGFVEKEIPQPKDNEVLVKLEYVGICGSDMRLACLPITAPRQASCEVYSSSVS